ncbi:von Willebrand factor type A domain-containing protein [Stieleria sp. JC731]|uniref:YfbK domain-containing protein n=1 Tax=Pirellulaceae TaxID=2691357 RepID=UPI001E5CC8BE|nr:von Willebrand factor type A domain-containing protein [Stieleria sp. JC731]MCC9600806.1 von Willebrand factor type A domain-containing protein [Stieleria sp. JC731]
MKPPSDSDLPADSNQYNQWLNEQATAYVFNELTAQQQAEFVSLMNESESLREMVNSIRDAAATLQGEFASVSRPLQTNNRNAIEAAIRQAERFPAPPVEAYRPQSSSSSFGWGLAIAATLLLACGLTFPALNRVISARTETEFLRSRMQEVERQNRELADRNQQFENQIQELRTQLAADRKRQLDSESAIPIIADATGNTRSPDPNGVTGDVTDAGTATTNVSDIAMSGSNNDSRPVRAADIATDADNEVRIADVDRDRDIAAEVLATERMMDDTLKSNTGSFAQSIAGPRRGLFESAAVIPVSSFPVSVENDSYLNVRQLLAKKRLPTTNQVRVEQLVNHFDYEYKAPEQSDAFSVSMDIASCPWNPSNRLARIGIQGRQNNEPRRPANLVFLIDVSGSMNQAEKLPLATRGLMTIADQLDKDDSIAIVVYSGSKGSAKGLVLDATTGNHKREIVDAIAQLRSGGSNKQTGPIQLAYKIAKQRYIPGGNNSVVLCTDDDCNVGFKDMNDLSKFITDSSDLVAFSAIQFGQEAGDHQLMRRLTTQGKGQYRVVKNQDEAHVQFLDQIQMQRICIARKVDLRIEFNPGEVKAYRLIGFEDQLTGVIAPAEGNLTDGRFTQSGLSGDIFAGHAVTALYEIIPQHGPANEASEKSTFSGLKYQTPVALNDIANNGEVLTLSLQYKAPEQDQTRSVEISLVDVGTSFDEASEDFRFASAVAAFGMLLRSPSHHITIRHADDSPVDDGDSDFEFVQKIAANSMGEDPTGFRSDFVSMVKQAGRVIANQHG